MHQKDAQVVVPNSYIRQYGGFLEFKGIEIANVQEPPTQFTPMVEMLKEIRVGRFTQPYEQHPRRFAEFRMFVTRRNSYADNGRRMEEDIERAILCVLLFFVPDMPSARTEEDPCPIATRFDETGHCCLPLPESVRAQIPSFLRDLDRCTTAWFQRGAQKAFSGESAPPRARAAEWEAGKRKWGLLSADAREEIVRDFDPARPDGMRRLFGPRERKEALSPLDADLGAYVDDRLRFVRQGNSRLALATIHRAWVANGFGLWAHLNPDVAVHALLELVRGFAATSFPFAAGGLPHLIYKPCNGIALATHFDQISPSELIRLLEAHVASEDARTSAWVRRHGVQSLAHLEGGIDDGYTYTIGPMTPTKLLLCMRALADGTLGVADEKIFRAGRSRAQFMALRSGPFFVRWLENLARFNAVLAAAGESPVGKVPLRPARREQGFVALWPRGFPHGSAPNRQRRVSATIPLTLPGKPGRALDPRVARRLAALAKIAATGDLAAERWIEADSAPYEEGATHARPHEAGRWISTDGAYRDIAVRVATADSFRRNAEPGASEELDTGGQHHLP